MRDSILSILTTLGMVLFVPALAFGGGFLLPFFLAISVVLGVMVLMPFVLFYFILDTRRKGKLIQRFKDSGFFINEELIRAGKLTKEKLSFVDLDNLCISGHELRCSNLNSATLIEAKCSSANFNKAFLREASLRRANCTNANFKKAVLTEADLSKCSASGSDFEGAKIIGADLFHTNLKDANLKNAKLQNSKMIGTNLENADLSYSNLKGAILKSVNLKGVNLSSAVFNSKTVLPFSRKEALNRGMVAA